jgi:hypothetical protein
MPEKITLKDQLRWAKWFYEQFRKPELAAIIETLKTHVMLEEISIEIRGTDAPIIVAPKGVHVEVCQDKPPIIKPKTSPLAKQESLL